MRTGMLVKKRSSRCLNGIVWTVARHIMHCILVQQLQFNCMGGGGGGAKAILDTLSQIALGL